LAATSFRVDFGLATIPHDQETCDSCQDDASCATPIRYQSERKQADLISVSVTMPCARENDGRTLDHQTLEVMRLRAVDGSSPGCHPEDVAASLGMGRGTVYGWLARYREGRI
jgi:Helix-turn-helix domain